MSLSKNTIRPSNLSITPIKLKYDSLHTSSLDGFDAGITFPSSSITATFARNNDATRMDITGSQSRVYRMVKQLYYQNYLTGSVLNSASYWDSNQQSTCYSGSTEYENRFFPTASGARIAVIYIPPNVAGEQISRSTFNLKPLAGSAYDIWDDGNGNLVDRENGDLHVGNIIYSHGVIIITDLDYAPAFVINNIPPDPYYFPVGPNGTGYADTTATDLYVEFTP